MSDYLGSLAARSLNLAEVLRPRLASKFEPVSASGNFASGQSRYPSSIRGQADTVAERPEARTEPPQSEGQNAISDMNSMNPPVQSQSPLSTAQYLPDAGSKPGRNRKTSHQFNSGSVGQSSMPEAKPRAGSSEGRVDVLAKAEEPSSKSSDTLMSELSEPILGPLQPGPDISALSEQISLSQLSPSRQASSSLAAPIAGKRAETNANAEMNSRSLGADSDIVPHCPAYVRPEIRNQEIWQESEALVGKRVEDAAVENNSLQSENTSPQQLPTGDGTPGNHGDASVLSMRNKEPHRQSEDVKHPYDAMDNASWPVPSQEMPHESTTRHEWERSNPEIVEYSSLPINPPEIMSKEIGGSPADRHPNINGQDHIHRGQKDYLPYLAARSIDERPSEYVIQENHSDKSASGDLQSPGGAQIQVKVRTMEPLRQSEDAKHPHDAVDNASWPVPSQEMPHESTTRHEWERSNPEIVEYSSLPINPPEMMRMEIGGSPADRHPNINGQDHIHRGQKDCLPYLAARTIIERSSEYVIQENHSDQSASGDPQSPGGAQIQVKVKPEEIQGLSHLTEADGSDLKFDMTSKSANLSVEDHSLLSEDHGQIDASSLEHLSRLEDEGLKQVVDSNPQSANRLGQEDIRPSWGEALVETEAGQVGIPGHLQRPRADDADSKFDTASKSASLSARDHSLLGAAYGQIDASSLEHLSRLEAEGPRPIVDIRPQSMNPSIRDQPSTEKEENKMWKENSKDKIGNSAAMDRLAGSDDAHMDELISLSNYARRDHLLSNAIENSGDESIVSIRSDTIEILKKASEREVMSEPEEKNKRHSPEEIVADLFGRSPAVSQFHGDAIASFSKKNGEVLALPSMKEAASKGPSSNMIHLKQKISRTAEHPSNNLGKNASVYLRDKAALEGSERPDSPIEPSRSVHISRVKGATGLGDAHTMARSNLMPEQVHATAHLAARTSKGPSLKRDSEKNLVERPEPSIKVTIGRIEVRAIMSQEKPAQKSSPKVQILSLDDYLRSRNGGRG